MNQFPQNPSGASQHPSGAPAQNPYGPPVQGIYGIPPQNRPGVAPQGPYGVPPQNPYGPPVQGIYGVPPQNLPGVVPQGPYGVPGHSPSNYSYTPSSPLPLKEAIRQLPDQYIKVLTQVSAQTWYSRIRRWLRMKNQTIHAPVVHPPPLKVAIPQTFAQEMGKASWGSIWIQLLILVVITSILDSFSTPVSDAIITLIPGAPDLLSGMSMVNIIGDILVNLLQNSIIIPVSFFCLEGITYLIAKAFRGNGTFLQQAYTHILFMVPIGIITSTLHLIPLLGGVVVYGLAWPGERALQVFSVIAVHRLSGGKATAAVLIPYVIVWILIFIIIVVVIALAIVSLNSH